MICFNLFYFINIYNKMSFHSIYEFAFHNTTSQYGGHYTQLGGATTLKFRLNSPKKGANTFQTKYEDFIINFSDLILDPLNFKVSETLIKDKLKQIAPQFTNFIDLLEINYFSTEPKYNIFNPPGMIHVTYEDKLGFFNFIRDLSLLPAAPMGPPMEFQMAPPIKFQMAPQMVPPMGFQMVPPMAPPINQAQQEIAQGVNGLMYLKNAPPRL